MEKVNFKSLIEEVRFNSFVNSLLKMNEEQITVIASQLDEETRARVVSVLEANLPKPKKVKVNVPDAKADAEAKVNQQVIDIIQNAGAKPSDELNPPVSRPVKGKLDPNSLRAKYAKGPVNDPTEAGKGQPAADLKAGDMRSQFAKGPPTDAGVAKADADFNATSKAIGARRAAEKSASAINYPKSSMGNMKAKADTDLRTKARTDAETAAKKQQAASDSSKALGGYSRLNKIAAGLGAAALTGAAAYKYGYNNSGDDAAADAAKTDARNRNDLAMKVAGVERQNPIAKIGVLPQGNLKLGSKGDRVKQLQTELGIKADGIFGKGTAEALRKAQQGLGIQADAEYGTQTQSAMKRAKAMSDLRGANRQLTKVLPGTSAETPVAQRMFQKNYNADRTESTEYSSNRLIEGFKSIMSSGSPNLFEAAKKAKKDWDKDGKIESEKDEVWGSRFRAAGIQKEESEAEKAKKNPMSHERDTASSRIPNRELTADEMPKKKVSKVVQTGKNTSTAYKVDEEVEMLDEISDPLKRSYLDAAIIDHGERWSKKAEPEHLTKRGHFKKSWLNSPERKKLIDKLQSRRSWIQKTAKDVTGQKHFSDLDGEPFNAGKIKKYSTEEVEISEARESFTKGTRKIKSYALGDYHAEVRHNPDWQEYQVHFYKNGKHMGEGPVSYHGEDKEDAHDSAKAGLEFLNKRNNMAESVSFSDAELAHLSSIAEANPIAPVPDDYSGAAGGVSKRDLSDETVAEGIRGMRRKDTKFKDDPKRYSNEYPKSYREPGTMSKAEMRDHIEASVKKYLRAGGKIKKN